MASAASVRGCKQVDLQLFRGLVSVSQDGGRFLTFGMIAKTGKKPTFRAVNLPK